MLFSFRLRGPIMSAAEHHLPDDGALVPEAFAPLVE